MIDRDHRLPVKRQARLLDISRGTEHYRPRPVSERDLALMRRIDELHLEHPFAGHLGDATMATTILDRLMHRANAWLRWRIETHSVHPLAMSVSTSACR